MQTKSCLFKKAACFIIRQWRFSYGNIRIEKFEGTKTTVSDDGKNFDIKPVNITVGNTVILALYDNGKFIEMQSRIYDGSDVTFKTDKPYTNAKVMVWESLENMKPVCGTENVK